VIGEGCKHIIILIIIDVIAVIFNIQKNEENKKILEFTCSSLLEENYCLCFVLTWKPLNMYEGCDYRALKAE
jgi:hypothetical protein